MINHHRALLLAILASALLALVLLTARLDELAFWSPRGVVLAFPVVLVVLRAVMLALVLLILGSIVGAFLVPRPDHRRETIKRLLLLGGCALLVYVIYELQRDPTYIPPARELLAGPTATPTPSLVLTPPAVRTVVPLAPALPPPPLVPALTPPLWLTVVLSAVLIVPIVAALWVAWARRDVPPVVPRVPDDQLVAHQAHTAVSTLPAGGDLRSTIVRCYLDMSAVLSQQRGVQRGVAMTVRDFEHRLATAGIADPHIRRLTRLFEQVRYGGHTASAGDLTEALACLNAIVQTYGRPR